MQIEQTEKALTFKLEPKDWHYGRGEAFLAALKADIPKDARAYDETTKVWTISLTYAELFRRIKRDHYTDPNQKGLFDE